MDAGNINGGKNLVTFFSFINGRFKLTFKKTLFFTGFLLFHPLKINKLLLWLLLNNNF